MKKKILLCLLVIIGMLFITGCNSNKIKDIPNDDTTNISIERESDNIMENITNINITINNKIYNVTLENNETAKSFTNLLPQEFNMSELNGNEKYIYMDYSLPTNSSNPKHIKAGDIMLYGDNCLVIFYKSFDTSYSYTRIGHINNLPNLGNGNLIVKFEK